LLLGAALDSVISSGQVTRVEAQLILLGERGPAAPHAQYLASFERNFMTLDLRRSRLEPVTARRSIHMERWASYHQEGAAHLIAAAYQGRIDGQINDQYRSVEGARRFYTTSFSFPAAACFFNRPPSWRSIWKRDANAGFRLPAAFRRMPVTSPRCVFRLLCGAPAPDTNYYAIRPVCCASMA
jgi:hypothetical protein